MRRRASARFLKALKETAGCTDCGTTTGRLDLDHRDKTTKLFTVSHRIDRKIANIIDEVMKCDVRCASCHTLRHWMEGEKQPPNGRKRPPCPCGRPSVCRGMCRLHYTRWKRHGDPNFVLKKYRSTAGVPRI
jgi:hypothetical protein